MAPDRAVAFATLDHRVALAASQQVTRPLFSAQRRSDTAAIPQGSHSVAGLLPSDAACLLSALG